ncbi:MAG: hypothetical protein EA426_03960 [Spirochaetaceae bacterium]|nr:MAG: hypothetical protein EA426_03960 [Spirochaetaceae bacterium]
MRERGSAGLSVTIILLCVLPPSVVMISVATTAFSAAEMVSKHRDLSRRRFEAISTAAAYLNDQVIPRGVRRLDIPARTGSITADVTDLGSRFPVYSIPIEAVPTELWAEILLPGVSIEEFEAARTKCGPSLRTDTRFAGIVDTEAFAHVFTPYARDAGPWAPDPGAAVINVNTAPLVVIEAAIKRTGIERPVQIARRLVSLRERGAIGPTDLSTLDPSGRLQTVLRTSPVFLELRITVDGEPVRAVLERDAHGMFQVLAGPSLVAQTRGGRDSAE